MSFLNLKKIFAFLCLLFFSSFALSQSCHDLKKNDFVYRVGVDEALIDYLVVEIPSCKNIVIENGYANFILNKDNIRLNNGIRSELAINYPFVERDSVEYKWSFRIPSEHAPGDDVGRWWLIAQWHDQPNTKIGESWATFKGRSPPLALFIQKRNGTLGVGLYGPELKELKWIPVPLNEWLEMSATIRWSTGTDGSAHLKVKNFPEVEFFYNGVTMLNDYMHYFKIGQYRKSDISKHAEVHVKNISIKKLSYGF